jgi:hypothetical protein
MAEKRRRSRRPIVVLLVLAVAFGIWLARTLSDPWPAEQGVSVSPDEGAWTARTPRRRAGPTRATSTPRRTGA